MSHDKVPPYVKELAAAIKTPEEALPQNLSDYWLEQINDDLEATIGPFADEVLSDRIKAPIVLVARICEYHADKAKSEGECRPDEDYVISEDTFYEYLQNYHLELAFELIRRKTGEFDIEPATLDNVLSKRSVKVRRLDTKMLCGS